MKKRNKLTHDERVKIFRLWRLKVSVRQIAVELNRSHSTVIRELKRNASVFDRNADYFELARRATERAHARRSAASKGKMRLKCREIQHFVELHLREADWSPETIAGRISYLGYPISAEAIYQYINDCRPELKSALKIAGRSRRRRRAGMRHRRERPAAAIPKRSIEELPEAAKERLEIGHLELDALHGKRGTPVLQVKVDRCSRKLFLDRALSLEAEPYAKLLIERALRDMPHKVLKTILQDNGSEHADFHVIDTALGVMSYFCHPYCASERGTVENRNKSLRFFFPKGMDLSGIPDEFIEWVEDYFNNLPMKVLGFRTPNEVWNEQLKKVA